MMKLNTRWILLLVIVTIIGCGHDKPSASMRQEDKAAKKLLQGVWLDAETEEVSLKVEGDTIFYPDSTSMPAYFKIVGDTMILGISSSTYPIVKQSEHIFWFKNQNGDVVKLVKSQNPTDTIAFEHDVPQVMTLNKVLKKDTVVFVANERYHCYIAINPTRYKVRIPKYNDDGVEVDNIYYDNIIHLSIFKGTQKLFARSIYKAMYKSLVPERFLSRAILSNMDFSNTDGGHFHFNTTICIPDGASCFLLDTDVSLDGEVKIKLIE